MDAIKIKRAEDRARTELLEATIALARETDRNISAVCRAAGVSRRWFYRFRDGDFDRPAMARVIRLHRVLRGLPAEAAA